MQIHPRVYIGFLAGLCLLYNPVFGQEDSVQLAKEYVEQANQIYKEQREAIEIAKELYILAADMDPTNLRANWMSGKLYLETINKDRATDYFLRIKEIDHKFRFDLDYYIGRGYQYGFEFDTALEYYQKYRNKVLKNASYRGRDRTRIEVVNRRIFECKNAKEIAMKPTQYSIVPLGDAINSPWPDYAPVLNEKGNMMIFTSRRREGNSSEDVDRDNFYFEEIFISWKINGEWTNAKNIGAPINTKYHDANIALSSDGNRLYLYKDEGNGDVYYSDFNGDSWSAPTKLSSKINSSYYAESSVSETSSSEVIFYTSNRGNAGFDINMCVQDSKGKWYKSKNLGPVINTKYDEESPFLAYDGKTLYFSSKGHKGYGGFDIFRSVYDSASGQWSEPENLGYPINTPDDEIYFHATKDGRRGYFASVREGGIGFTDIFMVKYHGDETAVPGVTVAKEQNGENSTPSEKSSTEIQSKPVESTVFEVHETKLMDMNHRVYFNTSQSAIEQVHRVQLDSIVDLLNKYEVLNVEIAGYASPDGNPRYNLDLSHKRALIVLGYFIKKGIDESRIVARGYGSIENEKESKEESRRAEVKIVSKKDG